MAEHTTTTTTGDHLVPGGGTANGLAGRRINQGGRVVWQNHTTTTATTSGNHGVPNGGTAVGFAGGLDGAAERGVARDGAGGGGGVVTGAVDGGEGGAEVEE